MWRQGTPPVFSRAAEEYSEGSGHTLLALAGKWESAVTNSLALARYRQSEKIVLASTSIPEIVPLGSCPSKQIL